MNVTWYEKGIEKGIESGRREALREMLEERFGTLPAEALTKLEQSSLEQLRVLQRSLGKAKSLRDLDLS